MAARSLQLSLLEEQLIIEEQILCLLLLRRQRRRRRRWCVRPSHSLRRADGEYNLLVKPMRCLDEETHFGYFRMSAHRFDDLLHRIAPYTRHGRNHHSPVTLPERLAVTLRVLASGSSQKSVAAKYKLGSTTVSLIVSEVCQAIWKALKTDFVSEPKDHDWADIAREFWSVWNFPNCLGCADIKHVQMKTPQNARRDDYEGAPSIVLMAVCDAKYRFTIVDVGSYGRESDGGIFRKSEFGSRLLQGTLDLPRPQNLPGTTSKVPHFFLGDVDFPLHVNMMRPYQGNNLDDGRKLYNNRHSRARRVIDDAFGILAARWRILGRPVEFHPDKTVDVVKACVALHNMLALTDTAASLASRYIPPGFADGATASGDLQPGGGRRQVLGDSSLLEPGPPSAAGESQAAVDVRDDLSSFFQTPQGLVL